ncbi:MAG: M48 family metalloprotease [Alphaproteobacteria bacterium]|nr:M48 family metalloprotease [Alphaproteobacteria bacterium]
MITRVTSAIAAIILTICIGSVAATSARSEGLSLIRDSEIENIIRAYAAPLFQTAGLDASAVNVHLVNDKRLNAFVAGGLNLFVNSGLLMESGSPGEIVGVLAHETGHLAGGHLARTRNAMRNASAETILAYVLGAVAAVAGQGDAAAAIVLGGNVAAQNSIIRYSQAQEQAADHAALRYLDNTGQSSRGLLDMFYRLEDQELLVPERQDPYARSHPLTRERISTVAHHVETSRYADVKVSNDDVLTHQRMTAKLRAFLTPPVRVLAGIDPTDNSIPARYARAIALYRIPETSRAIDVLDGLIDDYPADPWFHELKGQILFESGQISSSIAPYRRATELRPAAALLRLGLARALIETGEKAQLGEAITHLETASRLESAYAPHWYFLGIAYGRDEQFARADLAFAEAAALRGQKDKAAHHARRALKGLPEGSPASLHASDILNAVEGSPPPGSSDEYGAQTPLTAR